MAFLLDTDVVIHLRDGDQSVWQRFAALDPPLNISTISRIELENGVYRDAAWREVRRAALDTILEMVATINFTAPEIEVYRTIVAAAGFSKRKVSDRMTAATAIVHDLTLITMNGRDFRDIPLVKLLEWPSPI